MEELKKQINLLIDKAEESKLLHMRTGQISIANIDEGNLQAFKLIRLLIDTNLQIVEKQHCTK